MAFASVAIDTIYGGEELSPDVYKSTWLIDQAARTGHLHRGRYVFLKFTYYVNLNSIQPSLWSSLCSYQLRGA
jgi:hypothetical protein